MLYVEFDLEVAKQVWLEEGIAKGIALGEAKVRAEIEAEGRAEGKAQVARNMLRRGKPIVEIIEDTGLTREEIEKLAREN